MAPTTPITVKGKLVWTALILFGAGWMFVLGIMVGRGTSPIPKVLPHFENEIEQRKIAGETETNDPAQKQDLVFPEVLKNPAPHKTIKPVERQTVKAERSKPKAVETNTTPTVRTTKATEKATSKPIESKQPVPAATENKPAGPSNQVKGQYTVQVAAVKSVQNAEQLVEELRSKGFEAYQIRSQSENKAVWYRVRVGAFRNRSDAEKVLSGLNAKNFKGIVLQVP